MSLIPTVCSRISIFFFIFLFSVSLSLFSSLVSEEWEEETGNNNFSEIARLFPQKGNPIYALGRGRQGGKAYSRAFPLRFNI